MFSSIQITNLVVVSSLELDLKRGMTALTGETGAGKSILIDALGLALGDKADNSLIRQGEDRAEINVTFDLSDCEEAVKWLAEKDYPSQDECLLRRVLERDKKPRAYINGITASSSALQELGGLLLAIHGQNAHQTLLIPSQQRNLLDEYEGHASTLRNWLQVSYRQWRKSEKQYAELKALSEDRASQTELLTSQVSELEALAMAETEMDQLTIEHKRLSNLDQLQLDCGKLLTDSNEGEMNLRSRLATSLREAQQLAEMEPGLNDIAQAMDNALIQFDEAIAGLKNRLEQVDLDRDRLQQVEQRLSTIHDMARKYRVQPQNLPDLLLTARQQLQSLTHADKTLETLEKQLKEQKQQFLDQATRLREKRLEAATRLSEEVTGLMQGLNMTGGQFRVEVAPLPEEKASASGIDRITFLVSANPGQELQPLAKSASGGELSRISLAIQVATAGCMGTPTLIFDEVDTGIGGAVAEIVGQLLRRLAASRQVLCVTHLPQVATQAHQHLQVSKETQEESTSTQVRTLEEGARVEEIARMLGGVEITAQTISHAKEMIQRAQT